ncbi:TPA: helix-turn-helix domain-containing protein [Serratia marcescens]|nr:helix-turn-helix domain-containing protein [Serratia marcescens]
MLMSKSEYARHCGVSRQTVYDWIAKGDLVMSGKKIDAAATECRKSPQPSSDDPWPNRTMSLTWRQAAEWVWAHDGKKLPAATPAEARERLEAAADELGFDIEFLDGDFIGVRIYDSGATDEEEHYFGCDGYENGAQAFLRAYLAYTAIEIPEEVTDWSPEGLAALCKPLLTL